MSFDPKAPDRFAPSGAQEQAAKTNTLDAELEGMSVDALLDLRAQVDTYLPTSSLKSLNVEHELVIQLAAVKRLQREVLEDADTPANQRAQVAGQVASTLQTLAKLQDSTFNSERLKTIEAILVGCLSTLPTETQQQFVDEYTKRLG